MLIFGYFLPVMTRIQQYTAIYLCILLLLYSCNPIKQSAIQHLSYTSNCSQQNVYDKTPPPAPFHEVIQDSLLQKRFSRESLQIAHTTGIITLLDSFTHIEIRLAQNPATGHAISYLQLKQKIVNKIQIASLEVSAVASELDCEKERAEQVAEYIARKAAARESRLTVAAITTGATTAIVSGILLATDNDMTMEYLGIAAGVTEASLGMLMLTRGTSVPFYHKRNALREIWDGVSHSQIFPASVWYYLNYYDPAYPVKPSLRTQLLSSWLSINGWDKLKSKEKIKLIDLYFRDGGEYNAQALYNRAQMLDQLESQITLMKQDLTRLAIELEAGAL
jgi:hypothetical protein